VKSAHAAPPTADTTPQCCNR